MIYQLVLVVKSWRFGSYLIVICITNKMQHILIKSVITIGNRQYICSLDIILFYTNTIANVNYKCIHFIYSNRD